MKKLLLFIGAILFVVHLTAQTYTTEEKDIFGNTKTTVKDQYGRTTGTATKEEKDIFGNTKTTVKDIFGNPIK